MALGQHPQVPQPAPWEHGPASFALQEVPWTTPLTPGAAIEAEDPPIAWHGESTRNIGDLLGGAATQLRADAEGFMREVQSRGPMPTQAVKKAAAAANIKEATLHHAKKVVGVESWKQPGVADGLWWVGLPGAKSNVPTTEDAQVSKFDELAPGDAYDEGEL